MDMYFGRHLTASQVQGNVGAGMHTNAGWSVNGGVRNLRLTGFTFAKSRLNRRRLVGVCLRNVGLQSHKTPQFFLSKQSLGVGTESSG